MPAITDFAQGQIQKSIDENRLRALKQNERLEGGYIIRNGQKLVSFSCNDYLGLSHHPEVKRAACEAIEKYGVGGGASRLVTGNSPLYLELEALLATIKGTESALVMGSGFLANIGVIPAFAGRGDLIIADKLVHASIIDGCRLSGAKLLRFAHNDVLSCAKILKQRRKNFKNCLIVTETVFSMDGDIAPIDELYNLAENFDAWLMSDDAHGLGVISVNSGARPHIQMGTLSKAVGSYGGYVCAKKTVIGYLAGAARSLVYSTALPPATLASSIASLKIIMKDKDLSNAPLNNAILFTSLLGMKPAVSPVVPLVLGSEERAVMAAAALESEGFLVAAIRPPTVPNGTSRLRFAFSAWHKEADIERMVRVIKEKILL